MHASPVNGYAGPTPVSLEGRSSKRTRATAEELEDEQREELVKIFEKGRSEPRSLVDIPNSITHIAANYSYQFARLYLVTPDESLAKDARTRVARW
ncbi:MAG: hypothetical protein ACPGUV_14165, partial [Polyangiales bacterium]